MSKKVEIDKGRFVTAYKLEELETIEIKKLIAEADSLWRLRQKEYIDKNGHQGSIVICAGFKVWVLYPRCRVPRAKYILEPRGSQNEFTWLDSHKEIEALLSTKLDCHYCCGSVD